MSDDDYKFPSDQTWDTFVSPSVKLKQSPDTAQLIKDIMPHFPKPIRIIGAYLDDSDQFWKVAYHWELLRQMLDLAAGLKISEASKQTIRSYLSDLDANKPNPESGYTKSKKVGEPFDKSPAEDVLARWQTMKTVKAGFHAILQSEKIPENNLPADRWWLAAAPVAQPGTSKHSTGYALDVHGTGKNEQIKQICSNLKATLIFDEQSHVHVEFKQGAFLGRPLVVENIHDGKPSAYLHYSQQTSDQWYTCVEGKVYGPYTKADVEGFLKSGIMNGQSLIARAGDKTWAQIATCPDFKVASPK